MIGPVLVVLMVLIGWLMYRHSEKVAKAAGKVAGVASGGIGRIFQSSYKPVLAILAIALLFFWFHNDLTSIASADTGMWKTSGWAWHHLTFMFIFAVVGWFATTLIPDTKKEVRAGLRKLIVVVPLLLLFVSPIVGFFTDRPAPPASAYVAPVQQVQKPAEPTAWMSVTIPVGGKTPLIAIPEGYYSAVQGGVMHTIYQDGTDCAWSGTPCPAGAYKGMYIANTDDADLIVSYRFVPIGQ